MPGGPAMSIQGDFGECWLRVAASGSGLTYGTPDVRDLLKADVSVTFPGQLRGIRTPSVWVQVKTCHDARVDGNGDMTYDLDVATYEVLRQTNHQTRRILMVAKLSDEGDDVVETGDGMLLRGYARWVSLEGMKATTNSSTQAVMLPAQNRIVGDDLVRMLKQYGVPRSTPVPDVDEWG